MQADDWMREENNQPNISTPQLIQCPWLIITRAASANQNVTPNNPREKPEEWAPCLARKLKRSNRAMTSGFRTNPSEKNNVASSLMTKYISCNQMRQITFVSALESNLKLITMEHPHQSIALLREVGLRALIIPGRKMPTQLVKINVFHSAIAGLSSIHQSLEK